MSACTKGCNERLKYPYTNTTALPNVQPCANCLRNTPVILFCTSIKLGVSQETNSKERKLFWVQDDIFVVASEGQANKVSIILTVLTYNTKSSQVL